MGFRIFTDESAKAIQEDTGFQIIGRSPEQLKPDEKLELLKAIRSDRPKIVCLCGSGRFKEAFDAAEYEETLKGNIVLTIGCNTKDAARIEELKPYKPMLDELHLRKIDLADEVLILNVGYYVGESTMREFQYAKAHGKVIRYLENKEAK